MSNTIDYKVIIPSYKRYESISNKTLKVLKDKKIDPKRIYIFVANNTEKKLYEQHVDKKLYGHLIVGVKGLRNQRNFITKYFKQGDYIVQFDDDIEEIYQMKFKNNDSSIKDLYPIKNLHKLIIYAFSLCHKYNAYLWGIYPVRNAFFMTKRITYDLRFIVGPMFGKINRHDNKLKLRLNEKEDVERTLHHYHKDKAVIRFNDITIKTTYYKTKGGMQSENKDRKKESYKSAIYLNKKYKNYTRLKFTKKSGYSEVVLRDINDKRPLKDRYIINNKSF